MQVHRVWTSRFGRQNLVGRSFDYLSFYLTAFISLLRLADKNSIVIAKTDPPLISVIAGLAARLKSAVLINWIQDLFPEVAAALGVKLARGPLYGLLRGLRNRSLKQAQTNVVIGELMAKKLQQEGIPETQITVIHNWADGDQLRPIPHDQNPLRREWGLEGKFVVGYSGNLGRSHEFDTIIAAADALRDHREIVFLVIGGGAGLQNVVDETTKRGLENVVFKPYQPREKLSESLSVSDVHLISLSPQLEGLIVPSKIYGIMAVGRPILFIGSDDGQFSTMFSQTKFGYVFSQGDAQALSKAILDLVDYPDQRLLLGNTALSEFRSKYSLSMALRNWDACLSAKH